MSRGRGKGSKSQGASTRSAVPTKKRARPKPTTIDVDGASDHATSHAKLSRLFDKPEYLERFTIWFSVNRGKLVSEKCRYTNHHDEKIKELIKAIVAHDLLPDYSERHWFARYLKEFITPSSLVYEAFAEVSAALLDERMYVYAPFKDLLSTPPTEVDLFNQRVRLQAFLHHIQKIFLRREFFLRSLHEPSHASCLYHFLSGIHPAGRQFRTVSDVLSVYTTGFLEDFLKKLPDTDGSLIAGVEKMLENKIKFNFEDLKKYLVLCLDGIVRQANKTLGLGLLEDAKTLQQVVSCHVDSYINATLKRNVLLIPLPCTPDLLDVNKIDATLHDVKPQLRSLLLLQYITKSRDPSIKTFMSNVLQTAEAYLIKKHLTALLSWLNKAGVSYDEHEYSERQKLIAGASKALKEAQDEIRTNDMSRHGHLKMLLAELVPLKKNYYSTIPDQALISCWLDEYLRTDEKVFFISDGNIAEVLKSIPVTSFTLSDQFIDQVKLTLEKNTPDANALYFQNELTPYRMNQILLQAMLGGREKPWSVNFCYVLHEILNYLDTHADTTVLSKKKALIHQLRFLLSFHLPEVAGAIPFPTYWCFPCKLSLSKELIDEWRNKVFTLDPASLVRLSHDVDEATKPHTIVWLYEVIRDTKHLLVALESLSKGSQIALAYTFMHLVKTPEEAMRVMQMIFTNSLYQYERNKLLTKFQSKVFFSPDDLEKIPASWKVDVSEKPALLGLFDSHPLVRAYEAALQIEDASDLSQALGGLPPPDRLIFVVPFVHLIGDDELVIDLALPPDARPAFSALMEIWKRKNAPTLPTSPSLLINGLFGSPPSDTVTEGWLLDGFMRSPG